MKKVLTMLFFLISSGLSVAQAESTAYEPSTLSSELAIHIPSLILSYSSGTLNLWADFEYYGEGPNGELLWKLKNYGENQSTGGNNPTYKDSVTGMEFLSVTGGCYSMGDTFGDGESDEKPVHEVCVDGFYMGKYEVTNAEYRQYKSSHNGPDYNGYSLNSDNQPAVYVSWEEAKGFAGWLSELTGKNYRLPTEAEWEYAARAGTTSRNYWGNGKDDACVYGNVHDYTSKNAFSNFTWENHNCSDGYAVTAPVGSFKPNAFGLYDMMGNVSEWVEDVYSDVAYSSHSHNNPIYSGGGDYRVLRGGSWDISTSSLRASNRGSRKPGEMDNELGFRLVLDQ